MKKNIKKIREHILKVAVEVARQEQGALFVIGNKTKYNLLFPKMVTQLKNKKVSVFDKDFQRTLIKIATLDGAVIIDDNGFIKAFGAHITNAKPVIGFGTRHAAARGASTNNQIAILISEEEKRIKIFKNEKLLMEINPFAKGINKNISTAAKILNDNTIEKISSLGGVGTAAGTAASLTTGTGLATAASFGTALGIVAAPGIVVFATVAGSFALGYLIIKNTLKNIKRK